MKKLVLLLLVLPCFTIQAQDTLILKRDVNAVVLLFNKITKYRWDFDNVFSNCEATTLTDDEISDISSWLNDFIEYENLAGNTAMYGGWINLGKYKVQLMPALNNNNEKLVWVNAFCNDLGMDWQTYPVIVNDGRNCYFNCIYNLSTNRTISFYQNGF